MPKIQRIIRINKPWVNEKIKLLQHEVEAALHFTKSDHSLITISTTYLATFLLTDLSPTNALIIYIPDLRPVKSTLFDLVLKST